MGIKYKVSIETDEGRNYAAIEKAIEGFLEGNHVHENISDICRANNIARCRAVIEINVPPREF